jgi:hypothetical protein
MHLLSTAGKRGASTTRGCPSSDAAVLGHSAAWIVVPSVCPAGHPKPLGHLWTLSINGTVRTSTRTYSQQVVPVAAFHHVVVANRSQHSLDELSSANAKPHVVAHVE